MHYQKYINPVEASPFISNEDGSDELSFSCATLVEFCLSMSPKFAGYEGVFGKLFVLLSFLWNTFVKLSPPFQMF